jgi:hypothetical protein
MKNCDHLKSVPQMIQETHVGEVFRAKALVCQKCEAVLWNPDLQMKFNDWLTQMAKSKRDRFVLQGTISNRTMECVDRLIREYPGSDQTSLLRALAIVYVKVVLKDPSLNKLVESVTHRKVFKDLYGGEKSKFKIYFKPKTFLEIQSWAELADLTAPKFVEEAAIRVFSFYIETDPVMHRYWEETFGPELEKILAA